MKEKLVFSLVFVFFITAGLSAQGLDYMASYGLRADGSYASEVVSPNRSGSRTGEIQNLQIEVSGSQVVLTWQSSLTGIFKVYSSDDPVQGFEPDTSGVFVANSWTAPLAGPARFYFVTVSTSNEDEFVLVEGGTFHNGTSNVTLSTFNIGRYELTQAEYQEVMGVNPSYNSGQWQHPVETVSWFDAIEYCNRRSLQEGLFPCYSYGIHGSDPDNWPTGWNDEDTGHTAISCSWAANGYRLPTEMEWLFAASGGNDSENYIYSGSDNVDEVAWHTSNSLGSSHAVGEKAPNELGLYDMSGNVFEWVWDIYGDYEETQQEDPTGPESGPDRSRRGGAWSFHFGNCALDSRNHSPATTAVHHIGFRLCRAEYGFVEVEGGTFHNGTSYVNVSGFLIDRFELTQAQYESVMGENPSYFTGDPGRPVEFVTWFDAIEYCNLRSMLEGLTPCYSYGAFGTDPGDWPAGWNSLDSNHTNISCAWTANGYRLPTEMEWMFAARGGNSSHSYTYSGSNNADEVAWHSTNSQGSTHTVKTKLSNELGLFDMSGNVFEWVWDIYGDYPTGTQTDPTGPASGTDRVRRGGAWSYHFGNCAVDVRKHSLPASDLNYIGFRLCRRLP